MFPCTSRTPSLIPSLLNDFFSPFLSSPLVSALVSPLSPSLVSHTSSPTNSDIFHIFHFFLLLYLRSTISSSSRFAELAFTAQSCGPLPAVSSPLPDTHTDSTDRQELACTWESSPCDLERWLEVGHAAKAGHASSANRASALILIPILLVAHHLTARSVKVMGPEPTHTDLHYASCAGICYSPTEC